MTFFFIIAWGNIGLVASQEKLRQFFRRTVNGNGNGLVESVTISADECWYFSQFVELEVFCGNALGWLGFDNLEFDVVGLSHSQNGS
jgi:hypothetical protein